MTEALGVFTQTSNAHSMHAARPNARVGDDTLCGFAISGISSTLFKDIDPDHLCGRCRVIYEANWGVKLPESARDTAQPVKGGWRRPVVGDGATLVVGSDRYPFTVVNVCKSGKVFDMREDDYQVVSGDGSFQSGYPVLAYTRNRRGRSRRVRWSEQRQRWLSIGSPVGLGHREYYRDPHV